MGRLPFDASKMAAKQAKSTKAESSASTGAISVSQLAAMVDQALKENLPAGLKVLGEISQFRERTHWYFDIKDAQSVMSCVMWQSAAKKVGFVPSAGQQVVLTGRIEHYQPQGRTQFIVEKVEAVGVGALELEFRRLVAELKELGWFELIRKRELPLLPKKIAVVTSATGAALQDVLDTIRRRCASVVVGVVDVRVQGDGAATQVSAAIDRISRNHKALGVEVLLVTRGGGSMEDLWAFNHREVARAIVECRVPVVAAIGHETDTTIAELVADVRAATPTQAAMRIVPDGAALNRQLSSLGSRASNVMSRGLRHEQQRVEGEARSLRHGQMARLHELSEKLRGLSERLDRVRPTRVYLARSSKLEQLRLRLDAIMRARVTGVDLGQLRERLDRGIRVRVSSGVQEVEALARGLELVGPASVLHRGYSMTLTAEGKVVRSVAELEAGQVIQTRLADGQVSSVVEGPREGGQGQRVRTVEKPERLSRKKVGKRSSEGEHPTLW